MTRRALLVLAIGLTVTAASTRSAQAAQHYWPDITARPIIEFYVPCAQAGWYSFRTQDLHQVGPAAPDTFMVVKDPDGNDALSHLDLDELSWSPGQDKSQIEVAFAASSSGSYVTWDTTPCPSAASCPGASDPADALDFNGDGRWTSGGVRFDYSPRGVKASGQWPVGYGSQIFAGTPVGGPGLAAVGGDLLYAFEARPGFLADYMYAYSQNTLTGSWSSAGQLGLSWTPSSTGETAAAWFPAAGYAVVVHPEQSTGQLGYAVYDVSSNSVVQQGSIPNWPSGATVRQASVAVTSGALAVVFRDPSTNHMWMSSMTSGLTWTPWRLLSDSAGPITTNMTPGIANASDGNLYLVTQRNEALHFFSRVTGSSGTFTEKMALSVSYPDPKTMDPDRTRLNLVFLHYLNADGSRFSDESGYLAVLSNYRDPNNSRAGDNWQRLYTKGYISPVGDSLSPPLAHRQATILGTKITKSLGVAVRGEDAVAVYSSIDHDPPVEQGLMEVPFANGIPPVDQGFHVDNNDAATISANMCLSVWDIVCPERCEVPFPSTCTPGSNSVAGPSCDPL